MREHVSRQKKTTTGFSIPSLKHPIRGFGLESSAISRQAVPSIQPLHKPLTHDISRIPLRTQAKLSISQPGDIYEQEADSVAQQVMQRMAQPVNRQSIQREALPEESELQMKPLANSITPLLQREALPEDEEELQMKPLDNSILQRQQAPEDEEELQMKPMVQRQGGMAAAPDLEATINQARGGGQAIADNIRQPMEQAFGADFSGVKVHTDGQSDQLNRSIQARAFTTGQDVFFRQGEYNPGSRGGQELLAHELTHVVQQNGGAVQKKLNRHYEEYGATSLINSSLGMKKPTTEKYEPKQESSPNIIQSERKAIIQRTLDEDRQLLTEKINAEPDNSLYKRVLQEALEASQHVKLVESVITSGSVLRMFTENGTVAGYEMKYQAEVDDIATKLGNLVHELTHIAVDQGLDNDLVNYTNPTSKDVPERDYGALVEKGGFEGRVKGLRNQFDIQTKKMVEGANTTLQNNLKTLNGKVNTAGFAEGQSQQVKSKIDYGYANPHIEYDTVLNQIYVWCKEWKIEAGTAFYQLLEEMVTDAANRRATRNMVAETAPEAIAETPLAEERSCCYITTACMRARGLDDECEELMVLRRFRDNYLRQRSNGEDLVAIYYQYSPQIVKQISKKADAAAIYERLYEVIRSCVKAIKIGDNEYAYQTYCAMVIRLKEEYLPTTNIPFPII